MPLLLLHRRYERRCNSCGYVWEVPRGVAGMRPPSMAQSMSPIVGPDSVTVPSQPLKHSKRPDAVPHAASTISHNGLSRRAERFSLKMAGITRFGRAIGAPSLTELPDIGWRVGITHRRVPDGDPTRC